MDEIAYMRNINSTKLKDSSILLNKARDRNTRAIVKLVIDFAGIQNPTDEEIKDFKAEIAERSEVFNTGDSLSNRVENLIKRQLLPKEYNILLKGNLDDTLLLLRNADVIFNQKKNDRKFKLRR
jgi:ribosomal protein S16